MQESVRVIVLMYVIHICRQAACADVFDCMSLYGRACMQHTSVFLREGCSDRTEGQQDESEIRFSLNRDLAGKPPVEMAC